MKKKYLFLIPLIVLALFLAEIARRNTPDGPGVSSDHQLPKVNQLFGTWTCIEVEVSEKNMSKEMFLKVDDSLYIPQQEVFDGLQILYSAEVLSDEWSSRITDLNPVSLFNHEGRVENLGLGPLNSYFKLIPRLEKDQMILTTTDPSTGKISRARFMKLKAP